jgi:hypothetical protein
VMAKQNDLKPQSVHWYSLIDNEKNLSKSREVFLFVQKRNVSPLYLIEHKWLQCHYLL